MWKRTSYHLFGRVVRDQSFIENELAVRQLAIRGITEKSWFSSVRVVLNAYPLPSAYELLKNPPSKEQWKKTVKDKVHQTIEKQCRDDIESKSSLKYLNPDAVRVGKVHHFYASVRNNIHDVRRAEVKAMLLTGTYLFFFSFLLVGYPPYKGSPPRRRFLF